MAFDLDLNASRKCFHTVSDKNLTRGKAGYEARLCRQHRYYETTVADRRGKVTDFCSHGVSTPVYPVTGAAVTRPCRCYVPGNGAKDVGRRSSRSQHECCE